MSLWDIWTYVFLCFLGSALAFMGLAILAIGFVRAEEEYEMIEARMEEESWL